MKPLLCCCFGEPCARRGKIRQHQGDVLTKAAKHAEDFANVRLLTIQEVFGGCGKVEAEHLADGGILDQLYVNR